MFEKEEKPYWQMTYNEKVDARLKRERYEKLDKLNKEVPIDYSPRQLRELNKFTGYVGFGILIFSVLLNIWTDWFGLPWFISLFGSMVLLIVGIRDLWLDNVRGMETGPMTRIVFWLLLAFTMLIQYNLIFN
ncbi:hypothetical protein [Dyadobacter sp. CY356]|uniref:hypothetical protein n=1 Tax=Dyadobacter sp. CY356 TaxID=2906442 RepID=UPI001F1BE79D|nr:hypothetical protein [Dyadobacter sp. CY356]MCF0055537.1 hypothetical protein [Dyadobacter sp. CY356]